ncbi:MULTISPECIES: hypothetical protein [Kytococcus]|nr:MULTISPECIES: hypothetical protein [Kytococcus]
MINTLTCTAVALDARAAATDARGRVDLVPATGRMTRDRSASTAFPLVA